MQCGDADQHTTLLKPKVRHCKQHGTLTACQPAAPSLTKVRHLGNKATLLHMGRVRAAGRRNTAKTPGGRETSAQSAHLRSSKEPVATTQQLSMQLQSGTEVGNRWPYSEGRH